MKDSRASFLSTLGLGAAALSVARPLIASAAEPHAGPTSAASTPSQALQLLKDGNARFVSGTTHCGPLSARRMELSAGQAPFAAILSCSDSRVGVETVFDQIPGHLFGVRVAGNFLTNDGLGSLEYGVAVLGVSLILVLGHGACGAIHSTVGFVKDGKPAPGHIQDLLVALEPAAKATKGQPGDWYVNATSENVRMNMAALSKRSSIVSGAISSGKLAIAGGVYDLASGKVGLLS